MSTAKKFQDHLLATAQAEFHRNPLPANVTDAFCNIPRHCFVPKYRTGRSKKWLEVTEQNLEEHLALIYADSPWPRTANG